MVTQGLIHQYANLPKDLTNNVQTLEAFCKMHAIGGVPEANIPAGCSFQVSMKGMRRYIAFFDKRCAEEWIGRKRSDPLTVEPMLIPTYPGQYEFGKVITAIEKHCCKMRTLLDQCILGIPPKLMVSQILRDLIRMNVLNVTPTQEDAWRFSITAMLASNHSCLPLDLYIDLKGILLHSFEKTPLMLKHTRKCCVCGNYYQARGATIVHCSETCRSRDRFGLKGRTKKG